MFIKRIVSVFLFPLLTLSLLQAQNFSYDQWVLDEAAERELTEFVFNTNYRTEMGGTDWYGAPDGGCRELPYAFGGTVCTRLQGGIYTTKAIAYLAMVAHFNASATATDGTGAADRLVTHLQHLVSGGEESPARGGGIVGHHEGTLATALAFARLTPAVWNQLTSDEQNKVEWQMLFMMAAANFSQNFESPNGQARGVMGPKSFLKRHNPNLVVGNVETMIAAYYFFGGAQQVNALLADFDYDEYIATAEDLGFTNITQTWNLGLERWGKTKLNNDIRRPFTYEHQYPDTEPDGSTPQYPKGIEIAFDPFEIMFSLNLRNFYHTAADESPLGYGYQLGGVSTPVAGQQGMAYEFATVDAGPERSDLKYVHESLNTSVFNMALVASQGDFENGDPDKVALLQQRMWTGFTDFFFKAQYGWYSYQTGGSPGEGPLYGNDLVDRGFNYTHSVYHDYVLQFINASPPTPTTTVLVRARQVGSNCCADLSVQGMSGADFTGANTVVDQQVQEIGQTAYAIYTYTLEGVFPANKIRVRFANDAPGRDVEVDYMEVDGVRYESEAPNTYSVGVWNGSCNGGFKQSQLLACSGYFHYDTEGGATCENFTTSGTIVYNGPINPTGPNFDPPLITNGSNPSGGSGGVVEYRWQKQEEDGNWTVISGATENAYDPSVINVNTSYRRQARRDCQNSWRTTAPVTITLSPANTTVVSVRARLAGNNCCAELVIQGMENGSYDGNNIVLSEQAQIIDHNSYVTYDLVLTGTFSANQIRVAFTNDAAGRDLIVDYIEVGGERYQSEAPETYSVGVWDGSCNGGFKEKQRIACNGYFHYDTEGEITAPTLPVFGDVITLQAENGNYLGHNGSSTSPILANANLVGSTEQWLVIDDGDNDPETVGLQANNNQLLSAEKNLGTAMRLRPNFNGNNRERFFIEMGDNGQVYLRSLRHNTYVSVKSATSVIADVATPGASEIFNFQIISNTSLVQQTNPRSVEAVQAADRTVDTQEVLDMPTEIRFYPNPLRGSVLNLSAPAQVKITDLTGRTLLVSDRMISEVDLSALAAGVYVVLLDAQPAKLLVKQ